MIDGMLRKVKSVRSIEEAKFIWKRQMDNHLYFSGEALRGGGEHREHYGNCLKALQDAPESMRYGSEMDHHWWLVYISLYDAYAGRDGAAERGPIVPPGSMRIGGRRKQGVLGVQHS